MRERTTITQAGRRHCTPYNVSCCTCAHRPIIVTKPTYDQNASLRLRQCYNHCCTPQASCRIKIFSPHRHHRPALPRSHSGPTPPRRHCCRQRTRHLRPVTAVTAATKHGRNAQAGGSKRCCHERWRWQKGATAWGARERDPDGDKIDNTRAVKETKKKLFGYKAENRASLGVFGHTERRPPEEFQKQEGHRGIIHGRDPSSLQHLLSLGTSISLTPFASV